MPTHGRVPTSTITMLIVELRALIYENNSTPVQADALHQKNRRNIIVKILAVIHVEHLAEKKLVRVCMRMPFADMKKFFLISSLIPAPRHSVSIPKGVAAKIINRKLRSERMRLD